MPLFIKVKMAWLEEYKRCSCTFVAKFKAELPGHCPRHANGRKYVVKIPVPKGTDMGYVETG